MATTTNKGIEQPSYNQYSSDPTGWTDPINTNWLTIDNALGSTANIATPTSGELTQSQYRCLILNVTGTLASNVTLTIPSGKGGQWLVYNNTTVNANTLTIGVTGLPGTSVTVERGVTSTIYSDGTNVRLADNRSQAATAAGSSTQIQFNTSGVLDASANFIYDGSNVGLGTSSPLYSLANRSVINVNGASTALISVSSDESVNTSGYMYWDGTNLNIGAGGTTPGITFSANSAERFRVTSSGLFGIGTASPTQRLEVAGTVYSTSGGFKFPDGTTQTTAATSPVSVSSISFGSTGLTPSTATTGAVTVAGTLAVASGGTGITAFGTGVATALGQNVTGSGSIALSASPTFTGTVNVAALTASGAVNVASLAATGTITATGAITSQAAVTAFSDRSLKQNIQTIDNAVEIVKKLRGVSYEMINTGHAGVGVIAQEIQEVIPQVVYDNNGILSVAYGNIVAVLIEAIKELSSELDNLKAKIQS